MNNITIRELQMKECSRITEIDASQYIGRAWRTVDGERMLVDINYQDPDWPNGFDEHLSCLRDTLASDGCVLGAFDESDRLIGVVSVNRSFFGKQFKYVLLDQLFITLDKRRLGIGRMLFDEAAGVAQTWGADKFYICAGSAEETIAFYYRIGCSEVQELNQALYDEDPRDMHLEFDLSTND